MTCAFLCSPASLKPAPLPIHLSNTTGSVTSFSISAIATALLVVVLPIPISPVPSKVYPLFLHSCTNCIPTSIARNASSSVIAGSSRKSLVPCIILQSRTPGIFSALLIPISTGMTSTPACAAIFPTELCCFPIKEVTIAVTSCPD